jgi:hypothetical protein
LREQWGVNYENNLRLVNERFDQLFFDNAVRKDPEYWLGTTPEFLTAIFNLVEYEHGAAPGFGSVSDVIDASPGAFESKLERGRENLRRLGIANRPLFTIQ